MASRSIAPSASQLLRNLASRPRRNSRSRYSGEGLSRDNTCQGQDTPEGVVMTPNSFRQAVGQLSRSPRGPDEKGSNLRTFKKYLRPKKFKYTQFPGYKFQQLAIDKAYKSQVPVEPATQPSPPKASTSQQKHRFPPTEAANCFQARCVTSEAGHSKRVKRLDPRSSLEREGFSKRTRLNQRSEEARESEGSRREHLRRAKLLESHAIKFKRVFSIPDQMGANSRRGKAEDSPHQRAPERGNLILIHESHAKERRPVPPHAFPALYLPQNA